MALATPKNLHIPLPPKLYRALRAAADRAGRLERGLMAALQIGAFAS